MQWKRQRTLADVLCDSNGRSLSSRCANGSPSKLVCCPACSQPVVACHINDHLDSCLKAKIDSPVKNVSGNSLLCFGRVAQSSFSERCSRDFSEGEDTPEALSILKPCAWDKDKQDSATMKTPSVQLKVFKQCLAYVLFNHDRLFTDEEKQIIQRVYTLPLRLQELFRNILCRKNKSWHSNREFSNLGCNNCFYCEDEFYSLQEFGLIQPLEVETDRRFEEAADILNLLNVNELKQAYRLLYLDNVEYQGKQQLVSDLCNILVEKSVVHGTQRKLNGHSPRKDCWIYIMSQLGYVFRVTEQLTILFDNINRLCCIQSSPETPLILLDAMNKLKFPRYTCSYSRPIFLSRNAFLEFAQAVRDEEIFDTALCTGRKNTVEDISSKAHVMLENYRQACEDVESHKREFAFPSLEQVSHPVFKIFSGLWVCCNICWHSIPFLERQKDFQTSIRRLSLLLVFKDICSHRRGRYWNRLSLDILHSGDSILDALKVCNKALEDENLNDGERVIIARRATRLARSAKKKGQVEKSSVVLRNVIKLSRSCTLSNHFRYWHSLPEDYIVGRPVNWSRHGRNLFFGQTDQLLGVEELCLEDYFLEGWQGIHCEGSLMNTLFGIFFWNILFMDVVDVFQNEWQRAPFDLGMEAFYQSRSKEIEQKLSEIRHYDKNDISNEVITVFQEHGFEECVGVNWAVLGPMENLASVASLIPAQVLAGCFEKLSKNYRYWSGGQPDLFLWRTLPEEQVKFVEVKGPSDRLSERQHSWLCLLLSFGANVAVARVRPETL